MSGCTRKTKATAGEEAVELYKKKTDKGIAAAGVFVRWKVSANVGFY